MNTNNTERGSALLAVVIFALVLGLTCAAMVIVSAANAKSSQDAFKRARALSVAEIAVERAKANIYAGNFEQQFASQNHQALANDSVYTPAGALYGSYAMRVTENYGGVDGQYLVRSIGTSGDTTRQIEVVLLRAPTVVPDLLGAINLYNPNALANFSGQPPRVSGLDTNLPENVPFASAKDSDCVPGSGDGPDAVGISTHDDASVMDIIAELGNSPDRVVGADGVGGMESPSVYNVTSPNPTGRIDPLTTDDIGQMAQQYADLADYVYNAHNWFDVDGDSVQGNFGTVSRPRVVVLRNSDSRTLHMAGTLTGVGLLVVDCDVKFGGTFNYAGLMVITHDGNATVDVDLAGTPLILGSIIAANPSNVEHNVLDLRGTADVFYSRQGLALAQQALTGRAKFVTKYYTEKKPNESDLALD